MSETNDPKPIVAKSPDQAVAEAVVDALLPLGLIREKSKAALTSKLSAGKVTEEDWKLEIQLAITPKKEPAK